jgi:glycosyltransferase involved in cell wall biosynthesis
MIKKILIDARMYGLENAGIGRYLINLIDELKNLDKERNYLVLLRNKYFNELNFPSNWKKIEADFRHYTFEEQFKLPGIINGEKPDLVHFPHLNIPIFWKGKYVLTVHDLTMQRQGINATALPIPFYFFKRIPFLLTSRLAVKNAMKIIVPSQTIKDDVVSYYSVDPTRVNVVYEGVTPFGGISNFQLPITKLLEKYKIQKPYFLYVGNAYAHKNLNKAVEAIVSLNSQRADKVSFVICGSRGVFKERLESEANKSNASEYVKILDYISDEELGLLYKNSSGFVYPSFSEGFGLQGLEAMAAGTLVLASDIAVFREVYGDFAFYFDAKDSSSIAASMKYALDLEGGKKEQFIMKSQEFIKKYSWSKMATETLAIYKKGYEENL